MVVSAWGRPMRTHHDPCGIFRAKHREHNSSARRMLLQRRERSPKDQGFGIPTFKTIQARENMNISNRLYL
jgi:hypothetical protein